MNKVQELSIFDLLPAEEAARFKSIKSTDWKWCFADYPKQKNGLEVFSCFAGGGGSTMGYKLAACDVVGCCEIDTKMNEVYIKNHQPKHNYCLDIRKFNEIPNEELPKQLFNLDILDGSPPCTPFSMAGIREKSWGKKKKFREGQAAQILDDLSFVFIETAEKLQPKVVIMENVEGLIKGDALGYVQRIYEQFNKIGYQVRHWLFRCEYMGVPQKRHRVVFVAIRKDINVDIYDIDMSFNYEPIYYAEIKSGSGENVTKYQKNLLLNAKNGDENMGEIYQRRFGKSTGFTDKIVWDDNVLPTITANGKIFRGQEKTKISSQDIINASTFPQDYEFLGQNKRYICGMSVPPIMIKRIVTRLVDCGVFDYKLSTKSRLGEI